MDLISATESFNDTVPPAPSNGNTTERFINISAAVYVGILSVTGTLGNLIVLYVYIFKFKQSTFNTFIIFLAAFDIICSAIEMPLDVANLVHMEGFPGCKPIVLIATTTALATGFILVAIAVLRYKGICKPLKPNISVVQARVISVVSLGIAVVVSWPSAVMVANIPDELVGGMVVTNCATENRFKETQYPLLFNGILFLIFGGAFLTLIILYGIIGRQFWLRKKYGPTQSLIHRDKSSSTSPNHALSERCHLSIQGSSPNASKDMDNNKGIPHPSSNAYSSKSGAQSSAAKGKSYSNCGEVAISPGTSEVQVVETEPGSNSSTASNRSASKLVPVQKSTKQPSQNQNTFRILFIVTITFLLSYLPHLSLMIYEVAGSDLYLTPVGESFVGVIIRSYLINSASNPIIYGCCNKKFREETSAICHRLKVCFHMV
ncbi:G-protein coupled receptor 84-like [Gigantopelta aegis]|uniref:G-protein coupled receptor 84-like n=1 Tax=Gigantopelta aegis TaxID=1735272 RepID=UPI001B88A017|nr:G-protein coupled receptor 84-like [Gigantopelta aegis]XP_041350246.1 G-protein coupled receptor 84-like [Gigantopelta aegis]